MASLPLILLIAALICFILGAIPKVSTPLNLVSLGLACLAGSFLLGGVG